MELVTILLAMAMCHMGAVWMTRRLAEQKA